MWKKQLLKLSPQAKKTLEDAQRGIISPFSLSANGTKIGAHNWTHGIEEKSNRYLSPENAIKALAAKLIDYSDPNRPQGRQEVVAIMITSGNIEQFIEALKKARVLLPEPCFKQAYDYAKSSKDLQQTKMTKTPTIANPAFCNAADITPGSNRIMQSILRNAVAGANAIKTGDPSAVIKNLLEMKAEREQQNKKQVEELLKAEVRVWAFTENDLLEVAEAKMRINVPSAENVFTACLMYVGSDLSAIKGMLND